MFHSILLFFCGRAKFKNIEETELAKQQLMEEREKK